MAKAVVLNSRADKRLKTWTERQADGSFLIRTAQDVAPILDHNKALANEGDGYSPDRELRRVAFIPDIVALKWLNEEGWWCHDPDNEHRLFRKLNDPDWRHLRTAPGRL